MAPERTKDTGYWSDPFVQGLPPLAKLLFDYLWTNSDCNQAGLYHLTLKSMAFDTGIDEAEIPELLKLLEPKVKWWPDLNLVWVKNFVKRQTKSPSFLVAVAKCLDQMNEAEIVNEFLDFNSKKYGLEIPVKERRSLSSPYQGETKEVSDDALIPTPFEIELQEVIKTYPGWQYKDTEDLAWLRELTVDYPNVTVENLKACGDYFSDKDEVTKGPWKNRIRQWLKHDTKFEKEKESGTHRTNPRARQLPTKYRSPEEIFGKADE